MRRHKAAPAAGVALEAPKGNSSTENNCFRRGPNILILALQM